ncbi:hypothetical protein MC885_005127, partial [Smutsia gigantea]
MMPRGGRHREKAEEAEGTVAHDSSMQGWRELMALEGISEGSSPETDEDGQKRPFEDTDEEEDTGDEARNMLASLG